MLNTPRYAVPLCGFAAVALIAGISIAAAPARFPESHMGRQVGPTIKGDKNTPKKPPTHSIGALKEVNPNVGRLRGPAAMHESGMGRLAAGGEKKGDKNTPRRKPTMSVTLKPSSERPNETHR